MANINTLAIKARMANYIRKTLYSKDKAKEFTDDDAAKFIAEIYSRYLEMHSELNDYKAKRKHKAKIKAEREKRGYKPKKKTSKMDYMKAQQIVYNIVMSRLSEDQKKNLEISK